MTIKRGHKLTCCFKFGTEGLHVYSKMAKEVLQDH